MHRGKRITPPSHVSPASSSWSAHQSPCRTPIVGQQVSAFLNIAKIPAAAGMKNIHTPSRSGTLYISQSTDILIFVGFYSANQYWCVKSHKCVKPTLCGVKLYIVCNSSMSILSSTRLTSVWAASKLGWWSPRWQRGSRTADDTSG